MVKNIEMMKWEGQRALYAFGPLDGEVYSQMTSQKWWAGRRCTGCLDAGVCCERDARPRWPKAFLGGYEPAGYPACCDGACSPVGVSGLGVACRPVAKPPAPRSGSPSPTPGPPRGRGAPARQTRPLLFPLQQGEGGVSVGAWA